MPSSATSGPSPTGDGPSGPIEKKAERLGAHLVFLDESGFSLTPTVKRTWAPKGHTPQLDHWFKHDKLSTLSALTVSPRHRDLGRSLRLATNRALNGLDVRGVLHARLQHLRGAVVRLWDRGTMHTRREVQAYLGAHARLHPYDFPPDAPALNPAEHLWCQADAALANGAPPDVGRLRGRLRQALRKLRGSQRLLWSCIEASKLPWPR